MGCYTIDGGLGLTTRKVVEIIGLRLELGAEMVTDMHACVVLFSPVMSHWVDEGFSGLVWGCIPCSVRLVGELSKRKQ